MPVKPPIAVPGASSLMDAPSMSDRVAGETEEQRRKRLMSMQAAKQLPVGISSLADGYGSAMSTS